MRRTDELKELQHKLYSEPINKLILGHLRHLGGYVLTVQLYEYMTALGLNEMNYKSFAKRVKKLEDCNLIESQRVEKNNVICILGDYYRLIGVKRNKPTVKARVLEDRTIFLEVFLETGAYSLLNTIMFPNKFSIMQILTRHNAMLVYDAKNKQAYIFLCLDRKDNRNTVFAKVKDIDSHISNAKPHYYIIAKDKIEENKAEKIVGHIKQSSLIDIEPYVSMVRDKYFSGKTLL